MSDGLKKIAAQPYKRNSKGGKYFYNIMKNKKLLNAGIEGEK